MDSMTVRDYLSQIGKKGGKKTSEKYGKEHYLKLAEHMNRVRRLKREQVKPVLAA